MGTSGDDFTEIDLPADSDNGRRWLRSPVIRYVKDAIELCSLLDTATGAEDTHRRLDAVHREALRAACADILARSGNAVEQAVLTGMVGASLLATFDASVDYLEFQMDMLESEEGGVG